MQHNTKYVYAVCYPASIFDVHTHTYLLSVALSLSLARVVDGSRKSGVLYLFSARESSPSLVSRTLNQYKYYKAFEFSKASKECI